MEIWQLISLLVAIVGSAAAVAYAQGRREERLRTGLRFLRIQTNGLYTLVGMAMHALGREKIFTEEESSQALQTLVKMVAPDEIKSNPLTPEQTNSLNGYLNRLRTGEYLQAWEIDDYNALLREMEKENPDNPNIWPLIAIGAFLIGLLLASKR